MRFVWAVVAFLAAVGLIGTGVAQMTILRGPDQIVSDIEPSDPSRGFLVIDAEVLAQHPGQQTLTAEADGEIFAAYGRTADVEAWLSDATYNRARVADGEIQVSSVDATDAYAEFGERQWWNPRGSDIWIEERVADGELSERFALPDGMSLVLATTGSEPAPSDVRVSWAANPTTPWAGPLIAAGCLALLAGVVFWILGVVHLRRRRGPRRKGPKLPPTQPVAVSDRAEIEKADPADGADEADESAETKKGRAERVRVARRAGLAFPAFLGMGALLAGCSPTAWPEFGASPSPSPSADAEAVPEDEPAPAITDAQADRIVGDIARTVAEADEARDADLLSSRMFGPAYDLRAVNYDIRGSVGDYQAPTPIPDSDVQVLLPQANDGWPRTALAVLGDDEGAATPTMFTMRQDSPWSQYRVDYVATIGANTEIPGVAPAWLGAALVPPETSFLQLPPEDLAVAYSDTIEKGEDSEYAALFDLENDPFRAALEDKRQQTRDTFYETGDGTAEIDFASGSGQTDPVALTTLDSGAIVAVTLHDWETIRPTDPDAVIRITDPVVQHFTGEEETATGLQTRYEGELFFFVPARTSEEPIRLLGFGYGMTGSELIPDSPDEEE